jgi:two-component system CheB/CheR fusion protein
VALAFDGPTAIEVAREHRPEFILLDIGLPGMDGYEVARWLRQEEYGRNAVLIATSGYGQEEDRRRSKQAGFDHHLVKPVNYAVLTQLLASRLVPRPD